MRKPIISSISFLAMAIAATPSGAAPPPSFMGLGDLPGGVFDSKATGVSADGQVVILDAHSEAGQEATIWSAGSGLMGLGSAYSEARGVSADGSTVVGRRTVGGELLAYKWTQPTGMLSLPGNAVLVHAVSASGAVAAGIAIEPGGTYQAARWAGNNNITLLGDLSGGIAHSEAFGISSSGEVVVGYSVATGGDEAFRWTQTDGMVGLGDLPDGSYGSRAQAVSADGSTITGHGNSASGQEVFRWTQATGMVSLGIRGEGWDISDDGQTIVGQWLTTSGNRAFLWDTVHGPRLMDEWLSSEYGLDLSGWTLLSARGMSADGMTFVGEGINPNGDREGWIVRLPEPTTALCLGIGAAMLILRRRVV